LKQHDIFKEKGETCDGKRIYRLKKKQIIVFIYRRIGIYIPFFESHLEIPKRKGDGIRMAKIPFEMV